MERASRASSFSASLSAFSDEPYQWAWQLDDVDERIASPSSSHSLIPYYLVDIGSGFNTVNSPFETTDAVVARAGNARPESCLRDGACTTNVYEWMPLYTEVPIQHLDKAPSSCHPQYSPQECNEVPESVTTKPYIKTDGISDIHLMNELVRLYPLTCIVAGPLISCRITTQGLVLV